MAILLLTLKYALVPGEVDFLQEIENHRHVIFKRQLLFPVEKPTSPGP